MKLGLKLATGLTAAVSTVLLTAAPAHASSDYVSDAGSWGWVTATFTWTSDVFVVNRNIAVNDTVNDTWCAEARVSYYGYTGNLLESATIYKDCFANGQAETSVGARSFYPQSVHAVSVQLCRVAQISGTPTCRDKQYVYR